MFSALTKKFTEDELQTERLLQEDLERLNVSYHEDHHGLKEVQKKDDPETAEDNTAAQIQAEQEGPPKRPGEAQSSIQSGLLN